MKSNSKLSRSLIVSMVLHVIVGVIGLFFWIDSGPSRQQDSINAVLMESDKPKVKRKTRPKRAQIRKKTLDQSSQTKIKILTSRTAATERGVVSAQTATKFSTVKSLDLSDEMDLGTNGIEFGQSASQIGRVIETPYSRVPKEETRPQSRLVKFIENQEGPQRICYCIDLSSSMLSLKPRKLKKIISIMQDSLTFLEAHDEFNIVTFSDEMGFFRPQFVEPSEDVMSEGITYFSAAYPQKRNSYADKDMLQALEAIQKTPPTIIVLFSDGILTSGVPNPKEIQRTAAASALVFAMGIEMAEDFPGAVLLEMLADNSNGEFWLVD